jgi:hypothetical protein
VGLAVGGAETVDGDVRVDLGGREGGVAEELLDGAEVGAAGEEVGGCGVPEAVRAQVGGAGYVAEAVVDDLACRAGIQASAADSEEQGWAAARGGEYRSAVIEPGFDRSFGRDAVRNGAFAVSLADHAEQSTFVVDVVHV